MLTNKVGWSIPDTNAQNLINHYIENGWSSGSLYHRGYLVTVTKIG